MGRFRDELVASNYRRVRRRSDRARSDAASTQLSDVTRRGFQDLISTLAARLAEKNIPDGRAGSSPAFAVTSMEGALMLSRVLRSTAPFDTAIAELAASAEAAVR